MKLLQHALELARHGRVAQSEIEIVTPEDVAELSVDDLRCLHKIMVSPHVGLALVVLERGGFFNTLIPEIKKSQELKSSKHFKEIWPHTIRVINQTPPDLLIRWGALFHDLGKAKSFRIKSGKVTFHHHEAISANIFLAFAKKTGIFTKSQRDKVHFLVEKLGYIESYLPSWADSGVRRFTKEVGGNMDDLFTLSRADITTGNPKKKAQILRRIEEFKARIVSVKEADAKLNVLPKGLGNELVKMGVPVGPEIGNIRKKLEGRIHSGDLLPRQDVQYYLDNLKSS